MDVYGEVPERQVKPALHSLSDLDEKTPQAHSPPTVPATTTPPTSPQNQARL